MTVYYINHVKTATHSMAMVIAGICTELPLPWPVVKVVSVDASVAVLPLAERQIGRTSWTHVVLRITVNTSERVCRPLGACVCVYVCACACVCVSMDACVRACGGRGVSRSCMTCVRAHDVRACACTFDVEENTSSNDSNY